MAKSKRKYLNMTDIELVAEINRVQDTINHSHNVFNYKQNKVYLAKLHNEWGKRKHERTTKERF